MLRNDPIWVAVFVIILLASISLAAFAAKRRWLVIAGAGFFLALGGFTWLAGDVSRAAERPHLVATAETTSTGLVKITTTVKADGLRTKELIYLLTRGHIRAPIDPTTGESLPDEDIGRTEVEQALKQGSTARTPGSLIKEAALGPNATGSIDATYAFEVSPAVFKDVFIIVSRTSEHVTELLGTEGPNELECVPRLNEADDKLNRACVRFILPFGAIRPSLAVSVGSPDSNGARLLTMNVAAVNVPPSKVIALTAWTGKALLMQQTFAPDVIGKVQATPTTTVGKSDANLCIVTALVAPGGDTTLPRDYCDNSKSPPLTVAFAHL